jgi:hypothetical protein
MNAAWFVVFLIVGLWSVLAGFVMAADSWTRARRREQLEAEAWAETVAAMRRMYDRDGDA